MSPRPKHGFTLIEMLVAMTASLVLFGAVVTILQILGDAVSKSRRAGRLESDLCSIRTRLQLDLAGVTANRDGSGLQTEVDAGSVSGYFEVIEGPNSDLLDFSLARTAADVPARVYDRSTNQARPNDESNDRIVGDTDDLLFFTTRNVTLDAFMGKFDRDTISSEGAEVAYFCRPTANTSNPRLYTLYRRQLLIIGGFPRMPFEQDGSMSFPTSASGPFPTSNAFPGWPAFYQKFDVSARRETRLGGRSVVVLNTANDLQRRKNRFAHDPVLSSSLAEPPDLLPLNLDPANAALANALAFGGERRDEDVLAKNVLSFDVRLLDPLAIERQTPTTVRMQPGDESYWTTNNNVPISNPVYADLGFNAFALFHRVGPAVGVFGGYGRAGHCLMGSPTTSRTFDTWTSFYAANNQDDDGNGPVDNDAEKAPYSNPLGGIQVVIRLYDPETKTVKQATITKSFKQ